MTDLWPWDDDERHEAERRERHVVRRMGICVHFWSAINYREASDANGEWSDERKRKAMTCKAGVYWPDVELQHDWVDNPAFGGSLRVNRSLPCNDRLNVCGATCAKRETPTREAAVAIVRGEYEGAEVHRVA